uniref:KIB1-4 beta-propeller domain-containing protein n=1 Tax=Zea mays TaxID=4577 RepID=A0A804R6I4_MAIZE
MSSTSSAATAPRWADLPANVCDLVREHLDPITLLRFPAVCRHWFEACEESPLLPLGAPALLTSGLDPDSYEIEYDVEAGTFGLHDVSAGGGGRKSFLGKAEGLKGRTWVGGNHGWLTTINKGCDVELLNPLTGAWVRLPSFATISRVKVVGDLRVCTPSAYIFNNTHKILKVALCRTPAHAGYLAVVIFSNGLLAFTAAGGGGEGECRWTAVKNPATDASYMDAIVLDGKLFAVNEIGHVYSWDLDGGAMTEPAVFRDQRLISVANMTMTDMYNYGRMYSWDSRVWSRMVFDDRRSFHDLVMSLHELDASSGRWRRVTDFGGDRALFLWASYPFFITVRRYWCGTNLEADCVYLADTPYGYDVAIFDLNGHIKRQMDYSLVVEPLQMPMFFLP